MLMSVLRVSLIVMFFETADVTGVEIRINSLKTPRLCANHLVKCFKTSLSPYSSGHMLGTDRPDNIKKQMILVVECIC